MPRVMKLSGPRPDESGYRGRFARAIIQTLLDKPSEISRIFAKEDARDNFISGIKEGNWSRTSLRAKDLLSRLEKQAQKLPLVSVNTDAGVTQDLSKLIRVPNSIHGETGLIAKKVDDIDKFDPLMHAMIPSVDVMKIRFTENVPELRIHGEIVGPFVENEEKEMLKSVALFYVLKGSAIV
jgi:DNA primase small subunit